MPEQYVEHILLLGGIVKTGLNASSLHHPDEHYDHLYGALSSGSRIQRITLVKGSPVHDLFGLRFEMYNEEPNQDLEGKIIRTNQRVINVGFGPRLDKFLQRNPVAKNYTSPSRNVYGLRGFPVLVMSKYEFMTMEEIFEDARNNKTGRKTFESA